MRKLFTIFIFASLQVFSQNIDSLKNAFRDQKDLKAKASTGLAIVRHFNRIGTDSVRKYLSISKELAQKCGDKKLQAENLLAEATYLQNISQYPESMRANEEAIVIFETLNDKLGLALAYSILGLTYKKNSGDDNQVLGFSNKALEYENKALQYYLAENDFDGLLRVYSNIGIIQRDLKQFKEAETSYLNGIKIAKKKNFKGFRLGVLKANLSQIYLDYYKNHYKAIELLNEAIEIFDQNGIYANKEHAYRNISYNYTELKEYDKAIFYANKAIKIANDVKDPHRKIMAYSSLHHAQKMAGMYKESMVNLEFLNDIEDSLFSMEKTNILAEMNAKFETVKKEAEIKVLNSEMELSKLQKTALLVGLMLVSTIGVGIVVNIQQKRKRELKIAEQEKVIEHEKLKNTKLELEFKQKELTAKILQLARKNEFLGTLEKEVETLKDNVDSSVNKASGRISRLIRNDVADDSQWEQFSTEFSTLNKDFLDALISKHGSLNKSEIRLISLLKMNLSSKDIADTLNVSADGIKKARYRLRKRLELNSDEDIQAYLLSFS